jgi:hypothetical protein
MNSLMLAVLVNQTTQAPIDRFALVSRHNVELTKFDGERPLQVGNGEFAFGMDITGLQTFAPFNTMSQWGWHSSPLPLGTKISDFEGQTWDTHGRPVRYPMSDPNHPEISEWLAENPHRINLGRIGLTLKKKDGTLASIRDLKNTHQVLDLWNGIVTSRFQLEGTPVIVNTACHPTQDSIAVYIESPLIKEGKVSVFFSVPGHNGAQFANYVGDSSQPGHFDEHASNDRSRVNFTRQIDNDIYSMSIAWQGDAKIHRPETGLKADLKIITARYGAKDKWLDVTNKVEKAIQNGRLLLHVDNNLGPDPILNTVKNLEVVYVLNGHQKTIITREGGTLSVDPFPEKRELSLQGGKSGSLSFSCSFAPKPIGKSLPEPEATFGACRQMWPKYWKSGGAIDLSQSKDPRWKELERRIVLSQYLMKVNEAGSLPPQESGLVNNGWFGKFHLEMTWWHAAHWALWNRFEEQAPSMTLYGKILAKAKERARSEGLEGAHWPTCIGPTFVEWPHEIHALLMWQQPHPIFFAEMDYRAHPTRATLEKWQPIVEATADFLASYAFFDEKTKRYDLGPPIFLASENTDPKTSMNPTFELGYWRFGLRTAQEWRKRLGLKPNEKWLKVTKGLSPLPVQDGLYVLHENVQDMWIKFAFEHPALTATYGLLPGDGVDKETMRKTLNKILTTWNFERTWGWDYPMLAMCAARLSEPEKAIDFLMTKSEGFQFDERGLATGGPFPYFPSNGGLLYAVALMSAGWDGAKADAPGFPKNGQWTVRHENLNRAQ